MRSGFELGWGTPALRTERDSKEGRALQQVATPVSNSLGTWRTDLKTSVAASWALLGLGLGTQGTQWAFLLGRASSQFRPWAQTAVA